MNRFLFEVILTVSTFFLLDMSWLVIKPIQFTNQMNEFAFDSANGFIYASQTQCTLTSIPTSISLTIRRSDTRWLVIESSYEKILERFFNKRSRVKSSSVHSQSWAISLFVLHRSIKIKIERSWSVYLAVRWAFSISTNPHSALQSQIRLLI